MTTGTISLSPTLYQAVARYAQAHNQSPDRFVEELLARHLLPPHAHIEIVESRSGPRAVIRGTRVGVDTVVGYVQAGYSPQEIAGELLPHLTPAQVYDAASFYYDHQETVDAEMAEHTTDAWRERLRQRMGDDALARLTGVEAEHA